MLAKEEENMKRAQKRGKLIENCTFAGLLVGGAMCVAGVITNAEYNCDRTHYPNVTCEKPWDMSVIYAGLGVAGATLLASMGYSIYERRKMKKALDDALK